MSHTRKLAAIMFTDIVGYTALMQQSEQAALEIRKRHREIFESATATHGGRIIQYYGDGTLSIFESSVEAVHCGIELQQRFQTEPVVPVRIGLHTGDILIDELDIIGDSVNLASRIESMGVPGSVLVSGKVAEEIKNQDDLPLILLGKFHFKNDDRERQVFALNVPGLVIPQKKDMQGKLRKTNKWSRKKIAQFVLLPLVIGFLGIFGWQVSNLETKTGIERIGVLPFFNRMNDPEQDQLVDGVHEALISELQQAGISVKGRTSMMHYLYIQNRPKEAQSHMNMALELDPFNPLLQSLYGMTQNYGRRYEEVIEILTQTMEKSPEDFMPLSTLRTTFHLAGRYEEALDIWRKYYQIRKDSVSMATLEMGYQEGGYSLALQRLAELLVARSKLKHVSPFQIATLYTRAGKSEEALDWRGEAYLEHDANMPYIAIDPIFDEIRTHPRFRALLQKMDLLQNEVSV